MRAIILASVSTLTFAACSGGPSAPIRDFGTVSVSQFENDLETQNELSLPPSFQTLPQPTPGGPNLADN